MRCDGTLGGIPLEELEASAVRDPSTGLFVACAQKGFLRGVLSAFQLLGLFPTSIRCSFCYGCVFNVCRAGRGIM
jgi:hypothetical protein